MVLAPVDQAILGAYLALVIGLGLWLARRAGESEESFFLAGRRLPWWLAGTSLIATSFSIDTPLGIAGLVEANGIAGVWFAWCFAIGGAGMLGYALFSELWRRSEVVTDAELVELRYGGRSAAALRLFKGLYFGVFLNALTLGWVLKAVVTLGAELFGRSPTAILVVAVGLTLVYAAVAGLWGVVVSDLPQYLLVLGAMAFLTWVGFDRVGGPSGLAAALGERFGAEGAARAVSFVPAPGDPFFGTFLAYVLLLWWAHKNANASGAVVQRLLACRNEREARRSTLLFSVMTFSVNYWPMIAIALSALALYPALSSEQAFARLLGEGLPAGARGLVVAALAAAFMSTMDSHLNLGAAYLVHDVVRRFLRPCASERELVLWGRLSTAVLLLLAVLLSYRLESVSAAWTLLAAITSGYGLVTVLRWFWWRINAWSEIVALAASGLTTWGVRTFRPDASLGAELATVVAVSTPLWLAATFLTPPVAAARLKTFVERVRPWGWWGAEGARLAGLGRRLGLWAAGTAALLTLNFAIGAALFARWPLAAALLAAAAAALGGFWKLDGAAATGR